MRNLEPHAVLSVCFALLMALFSSACRTSAPENSAALDGLDAMRAGTWQGRELPALVWSDVDALLERTESGAPLLSFPLNPLSSQSQASCSEGMMALWMIEAVRRDLPMGYPSLNPLVFDRPAEQERSWEEASESHRPAMVAAYRGWWTRVRELEPAQRRVQRPLAGTTLNWYGTPPE